MDSLRAAIRAGIADVWGSEHVPDSPDSFRPHVSLAYSNRPAPVTPLRATMERTHPQPATTTFAMVALITLARDEHLYRWETFAPLSLTTAGSTPPAQ